jgi:predicted ArsR family transcriptional regulator
MRAQPRTEYQRGRILAAIATEALTAQQLADKLHLTRDAINIHLKAMKTATPRAVHISGLASCSRGGRPAPRYSPGDKPDAVYTSSRAPTRHLKIEQNFAATLKALRATSMTSAQLGEVLGVSANWARHFVAKLREEHRVYISGWIPMRAGIAPTYTLGDREDVPRPVCDKKAAYMRLKERRKTDPDAQERYERDLRRRAIKDRIAKLKTKPQPWFAALPGAQAAAKAAA